MPTNVMHHMTEIAPEIRAGFPDGWPWRVIGVFPTDTSERPEADWFNYTSGLGLAELHVPCCSIEGRALGNEIACAVLNVIAGGWRFGIIGYGDSIVVPLGVPDENGDWSHDVNSIWWVHDNWKPARELAVNMTEADYAIPILWSSPLGWPD